MIVNFFRRYASRVVQKAHARVTAENARYVQEAIEKDAEVERLTQERDQALKRADDCQKQGVTLARTLREQLASIKDTHVRQLAQRDELIARMDTEHADLSGQLQTALERIAELEECL